MLSLSELPPQICVLIHMPNQLHCFLAVQCAADSVSLVLTCVKQHAASPLSGLMLLKGNTELLIKCPLIFFALQL